jgi:hypothetical protein
VRIFLALLILAACRPPTQPIALTATTPDGGLVELSLTYPEASCPLGTPSPCYRYEVRFAPTNDFSPFYGMPSAPPRPELSPIPPESLRARLNRQLDTARRAGQAINLEGVNRFLARESHGGFVSLCALRMAIEAPAYGRVVLHFYDAAGKSLYRRDPTATEDQALSPGWTDRADEGHQFGGAWYWKGRFAAEALPLEALARGVTLRATLQPACRSSALPYEYSSAG